MRSKFINADSKLRSKRIATEDSETNLWWRKGKRGVRKKFLEDEERLGQGLKDGWRFGRPKWSRMEA